jgi:hypothetical protein
MAKAKECEDKSIKHEEEALAREGEVMTINKMMGKRKKDLQAKEEEIAKLKNTLRHNQRNFERLGPDESDEINVCNICGRVLTAGKNQGHAGREGET